MECKECASGVQEVCKEGVMSAKGAFKECGRGVQRSV